MKVRTYNILDGHESAVDQASGFVVAFGEGRDEIHVSVNSDGRICVATEHGRIIVLPAAANCFYVEPFGT